jgi:hypothetical protein
MPPQVGGLSGGVDMTLNSEVRNHLDSIFFLLEETTVVREALEDWETGWAPWGAFQELEQFRSAWLAATSDREIHRKLGFYVLWDSVKTCFPEDLDRLLKEFPPEIGDYSPNVLRAILREEDFDGFIGALVLFFSQIAEDLEEKLEAARSPLSDWWNLERVEVIAKIYEKVRSWEAE